MQLAAPLAALDLSHQRLWLVAGNILKRGKTYEHVLRVYQAQMYLTDPIHELSVPFLVGKRPCF